MDVSADGSASQEQAAEFDKAFELLCKLVDLREADKLMPLGPAVVYTASVVLWLLVYQRLNHSASLESAVAYLLDAAPELCRDNKRIREKTLSPKTGSYSDARKRLTPEVTEWFVNAVSTSIIETSRPTWGDRRVFLVDGTTITLAPTKELRVAFPPATNQHGPGVWPVALLVVAHELESGAALLPEVGPMYGPEAVSEVDLAQKGFARLPPNSVIMADANFGIFSVAFSAAQQGHSFLLRLTDPRFQSLSRKATLSAEGPNWKTWSCCWKPTSHDRQTNPQLPSDAVVQVWIHEIVVHSNLTLWLVTDLADPGRALSDLYLRRGEVEIDIRSIKVVLDTENIRARSVAMFQKELQTSMVAYNLVVQFRRQAAEIAKVPAKRLSFTSVWTIYRQFLMNAFYTDPAVWRERFHLALHYAQQTKLPNRPGRSYPRAVYPRRQKSTHFQKRTPSSDDPTK